MTKVNSTTTGHNRKPSKPKKPHKDYPLTPHPSGLWCKKVRGKLHYFGPWDNPQKALERWLAEKDDLLAGRVPRSRAADGSPVLGDLVNQFLFAKKALYDGGELSPHTYNAYAGVCDELLEAFGQNRLLSDLLPEDFHALRAKWAKKWGPVRLANEINRARTVFNFAEKNGLIEKKIKFGEGFNAHRRRCCG